MIPLGEWLPDLPVRENPGATEAKNVTPEVYGYSPFRALSPVTEALNARVRGAASFKTPTGTVLTFAGTAQKLWRLNQTTWSDVSKGSTATTYTSGDYWRFTQFSDLAIATNYGDAVQKWTLGTSSIWADLGSNVPKARHVAVVGDFVMLGNIDDSVDNEVPNRVAWGPIGDPDGDWTPASSTQAGLQDLPEGGPVNAVVGGDVGYILCESAVYRVHYIGGDNIFAFDRQEEQRGCVASGSVATDGRRTIYLSSNGFYMLDQETGQSAPIGANKIDDWANDEISTYARMSAAMSAEDKLYVVSFASGDAGDQPDTLLIYNWEVGRWAYAKQSCDAVGRLLSAGYTLEQLDNVADLDSLPASLDSNAWKGGDLIFGAFDTDNKLASFTGSELAATVETAEVQLADPNRALVRGVRPVVDGTCTVQLGYRNLPTDSVTFGTAQSTNSQTGMANFHREARYHRARLNISGVWTKAQGVDVDAVPAGLL